MEIVATVYVASEIICRFLFKQIEKKTQRAHSVIREVISAILTYLFFSYCTLLIMTEDFTTYSFLPTSDFLKAFSFWPTYAVLPLNLMAVVLLFFGQIKRTQKLKCKHFYIGSAVLAAISLLISLVVRLV